MVDLRPVEVKIALRHSHENQREGTSHGRAYNTGSKICKSKPEIRRAI